jgi:hypothetical protein
MPIEDYLPLTRLGVKVAQVAPRNDEKGEWLMEKPCHLSLYIGWEDCNKMWF